MKNEDTILFRMAQGGAGMIYSSKVDFHKSRLSKALFGWNQMRWGKCEGVNMVQILCTHVCIWKNETC
jgi:hypothetical protein